MCESTTTVADELKKLVSATEKLKNALENIKANPIGIMDVYKRQNWKRN